MRLLMCAPLFSDPYEPELDVWPFQLGEINLLLRCLPACPCQSKMQEPRELKLRKRLAIIKEKIEETRKLKSVVAL